MANMDRLSICSSCFALFIYLCLIHMGIIWIYAMSRVRLFSDLVATTCWLVEARAGIYFAQVKSILLTWYYEIIFKIVMCKDTSELICFRLGIKLNTTKVCNILFQFEWPWCSLKVTGLRESKNLCSHFVVKLHEAVQKSMMVGYVRGLTVRKSCKYGEDESFEHLLFCTPPFADWKTKNSMCLQIQFSL